MPDTPPRPADPPPTALSGPPTLHIDGSRATIALNRPGQRNRLDDGDLQALVDHAQALAGPAGEGVRVVRLLAQGPVFCAGYDLQALQADPAGGPLRFDAAVRALAALPQPTVCRLHAPLFGGAAELALACDFRLGTPACTLQVPAARIGLHYLPAGLARFTARVGAAAARRIFLLALPMHADELLRIGYLDACVADDALDAELERWCVQLEGAAPLAVRGMKRSLDAIAQPEGAPPAAQRLQAVAQCAASDDLRVGLAAARQRRAAVFRAR